MSSVNITRAHLAFSCQVSLNLHLVSWLSTVKMQPFITMDKIIENPLIKYRYTYFYITSNMLSVKLVTSPYRKYFF